MATYQYNPKDVSMVLRAPDAVVDVSTIIVQGFAAGSMVRVSRSEDMFSSRTSADGEVTTQSKRNNRTTTVTITLEEGHPTNLYLSELAQRDEDSTDGYFVLQMKDHNGGDEVFSPAARIMGTPDLDKGDAAGERTWTFTASETRIKHGGLKRI